MPERELRCVSCDGEMIFEVPDCPEMDCPEMVCTRCGATEVLVPITLRVWQPAGNRRVAPQQRRAA